MKKALFTIICLFLLTPSTAKAIQPENNIYPETFVIYDIDKANDIVYLETCTGMIYTWEGVEDWMIGDLAAAIMDDNKTPDTITDDKILILRYTGYID